MSNQTTKKRKPSKVTTVKALNKVINDLFECGLATKEEIKPLTDLQEKVMENFIKSM